MHVSNRIEVFKYGHNEDTHNFSRDYSLRMTVENS